MTPLSILAECYTYIDDDIFTEWEAEFIVDLVEALERAQHHFTFSTAQKEKLEQIYIQRVEPLE